MAHRGHVPEFGKWDGSDVAYTKVFEVARKDKGAPPKMINPNDPQQNPEAFRPNPAAARGHRSHLQAPPPAPAPVKPSILKPGMDQPRSGHRKTGSTGSVYAQPAIRQRLEPSRSPSVSATGHQRGPSVPKFGAWNDSNASPSEGYTVIFNQVKDKRHTAAGTVPSPEMRAHLRYQEKESIWKKISSCFKPSVRD